MELKFNEEDIKKMLIEKAALMGVEANAVDVDSTYNRLKSVTVYLKTTPEPAPVQKPPVDFSDEN